MVKKSSRSIRQALGPLKTHFDAAFTSAKLLEAKPLPENAENARDMASLIEATVAKLSTRINSIMERDSEWTEIFGNIDSETVLEEESEAYEKHATADDGYIGKIEEGKDIITSLELKLRQLNHIIGPSSTQGGAASDNRRSSTTDRAKQSIRLPKIELPKFNGDVLKWKNFWALYTTSVHSNSNISNVEKFTYLQSQLTDEAARAVAGIQVTDEGYKVAIDILVARFEQRPEQIIIQLYRQLKDIPQSTDRIADLQRTFDQSEKVFRQLSDLGENLDINRSLSVDVLNLYPASVIRDISMRKHVADTQGNSLAASTVSIIQEAINDYLRETTSLSGILDNLNRSKTSDNGEYQNRNQLRRGNQLHSLSHRNHESASEKIHENSSQHRPTVTSTFTAANSKAKSPVNGCYFCGGNHFNNQCSSYATVEGRKQRLRETNRCLRCLGKNHIASSCRTPAGKISCFHCRKTDHMSPLCSSRYSGASSEAASRSTILAKSSKNKGDTHKTTKTLITMLSNNEESILSSALVTVRHPGTKEEMLAQLVFDNASSSTYIIEPVANQLKLEKVDRYQRSVNTFGRPEPTTTECTKSVIEIIGRCGGDPIQLEVDTVALITNSSLSPDVLPEETKTVISSMDLAMADDFLTNEKRIPAILLGTDYFWSIIIGSPIRLSHDIFMVPTKLGIIIGGKFPTNVPKSSVKSTLLTITHRNAEQYETVFDGIIDSGTKSEVDVDEFWKLERIGIYDDPHDNQDETAMQQFNSTVQFEDGRYQVTWPWNENKPLLPSNYQLSYGRFRSLAARIKEAGPAVQREYTKVIDNQRENGIIEEVKPTTGASTHPFHYLPHHPVIRVNHATTKLRIVYDASARCGKNAVSLNQCVSRGPVILPDLCGLFLRFRLRSVAVIADIEKAFLQLSLQPNERDVTRFFWFKNPLHPDPEKFLVYRFCRVPFGVISSPFLLAATIQHHLKQQNSSIASTIAENIYVDNMIVSLDGTTEANTFYDETKTIFNKCSMNIREWCSNSSGLVDHISRTDHCGSRRVKVLGVLWNSESDLLQLCGDWSKLSQCRTKRQLVQAAASIFDPTGVFQPVVIRLKIFLRQLWNRKLDWDSEISEELKHKWLTLHEELSPIFHHQFPRQFIKSDWLDNATLAVFCDASCEAYAASVYLRVPTESENHWETKLVISKSRLSPKSVIKAKGMAASVDITLPKLELLALVIGTRIGQFARSMLKLPESTLIYIFSDSTCVLGWIRSTKPQPVFVKNRVAEIKNLKCAEYRHVASEDNSADVCSRGTSGAELIQHALWWNGPNWLRKHPSQWSNSSEVPPICDEELRRIEEKSSAPIVIQSFIVAAEGPAETPLSINHQKFSSYHRLIRVTICTLKLLKRLWNRLSHEQKLGKPTLERLFQSVSSEDHATPEDIRFAKLRWIKSIQQHYFADVLFALMHRKNQQLVNQLDLRIDDDGIIRCGGRLKHADLPFDAVEPVLLPSQDHLTRIIVRDAHKKLFHSGVSHTLSQLRRLYWIPKGRNVVRNILKTCIVCKKQKGAPFALPRMPPLPAERVARSLPFQFCGVDYFGPINVLLCENPQKSWIALFTCFTTRAIHLECVNDCSTQSFINALSRFISRRGTPEQMLSDNAPQFRLVKSMFDRTWQRILCDPSVVSYISNKGIIWKHIIELAPWQGGMYERLVGIVKNLFKAEVGRKLLHHDEFITLIAEVESIVNSRPITYVNQDLGSSYALRPIDFLTSLPAGTPSVDAALKPEGGDASRFLLKHWKFKQQRLEQLWKSWYQDYLLSLREKHRMDHRKQRNKIKAVPEVNEVVIVESEDLPRGSWKLGKVLKLITSNDGNVRAVELLLGNGQMIKRTLNHLYPLELSSKERDRSTSSDEQQPNQQHRRINRQVSEDDFDGFDQSEVEEVVEMLDHCSTSRTAMFVNEARVIIGANLAFATTRCQPQ